MTIEAAARGLDNVVVTSSAISAIDGATGRLSYYGYDIHDLAADATFEEVCYLLWHGQLPARSTLQAWSAQLAHARALSPAEQHMLQQLPSEGHGMEALRSAVSALAQLDQATDRLSAEQAERIGLLLTAKMPTILAGWHRLR